MKQTIFIFITAASLLCGGCKEKEPSQEQTTAELEKKANPTFMFWCHRKEIVSHAYHIPDMKTPNAAEYLLNRVKPIPGYVDSSVNLENNTLTISYKSSEIRKMNFEEAIAFSGFSVNKRPAKPGVMLPDGVK